MRSNELGERAHQRSGTSEVETTTAWLTRDRGRGWQQRGAQTEWLTAINKLEEKGRAKAMSFKAGIGNELANGAVFASLNIFFPPYFALILFLILYFVLILKTEKLIKLLSPQSF